MNREASTPRYTLTPSGDMWRVKDNKTGNYSSRVYLKPRGERIVEDFNIRDEAVEKVSNGKFYTVHHGGQLQAVFFYGGKHNLTSVAARKLAVALSAILQTKGVRP